MKIVLISNFFNHHQKPLCDAFYAATKADFWFIETTKFTSWRRKMGYKEMTAPYVLKNTPEISDRVRELIVKADAVITDAEFLDLTKERYLEGKLIFRYAERLFKSKLRYLKAPVHVLKAWKTRNMYMLCSSAFTARDFNLIGFYKGKSFKWGYFPVRKLYKNNQTLIEGKKKNSILWVGRLIDWKHPESAIYVANKLSASGIDYELNIIGFGDMEKQLKEDVRQSHLEDKVHFLGSMTPEEVRTKMEESEIFLFTSDEGEGWGAVLNEAMNSGCAVVASNKIGSVPFMVKNSKNGLLFNSKDWEDLYNKVNRLLMQPEEREVMAYCAIETIEKDWNAENAANSFIRLATNLLAGQQLDKKDGPCSPI